jgi:peroxiredoxin Q/BCP
MSVDVGDMAPDFTLPTDGGGEISLSALKGKKVIVYFYPKDLTKGCTTQACEFRDSLPDFSAADAEIIGISKDSVSSHDKFKAKHELTFDLASDEEGTVCDAYGVWKEKKMYGKTYMGIERSTFLIDADGKIAQTWRKVRVNGHVAAVLQATADL